MSRTIGRTLRDTPKGTPRSDSMCRIAGDAIFGAELCIGHRYVGGSDRANVVIGKMRRMVRSATRRRPASWRSSVLNLPYRGRAKADLIGHLLQGETVWIGSDEDSLLVGHLSLPVLLPSRSNPSASGNTIGNIISRRSRLEMCRIHARRIVAFVADDRQFWQRAIVNKPTQTMGALDCPAVHASMSKVEFAAEPIPTFSRATSIHLRPEPLFNALGHDHRAKHETCHE